MKMDIFFDSAATQNKRKVAMEKGFPGFGGRTGTVETFSVGVYAWIHTDKVDEYLISRARVQGKNK